jgi:hypothetical protein
MSALLLLVGLTAHSATALRDVALPRVALVVPKSQFLACSIVDRQLNKKTIKFESRWDEQAKSTRFFVVQDETNTFSLHVPMKRDDMAGEAYAGLHDNWRYDDRLQLSGDEKFYNMLSFNYGNEDGSVTIAINFRKTVHPNKFNYANRFIGFCALTREPFKVENK